MLTDCSIGRHDGDSFYCHDDDSTSYVTDQALTRSSLNEHPGWVTGSTFTNWLETVDTVHA